MEKTGNVDLIRRALHFAEILEKSTREPQVDRRVVFPGFPEAKGAVSKIIVDCVASEVEICSAFTSNRLKDYVMARLQDYNEAMKAEVTVTRLDSVVLVEVEVRFPHTDIYFVSKVSGTLPENCLILNESAFENDGKILTLEDYDRTVALAVKNGEVALKKAMEKPFCQPQLFINEVEQLRMKLTECNAVAHTAEHAVVDVSNLRWSPAYQAVLDLRQAHDKLKQASEQLQEQYDILCKEHGRLIEEHNQLQAKTYGDAFPTTQLLIDALHEPGVHVEQVIHQPSYDMNQRTTVVLKRSAMDRGAGLTPDALDDLPKRMEAAKKAEGCIDADGGVLTLEDYRRSAMRALGRWSDLDESFMDSSDVESTLKTSDEETTPTIEYDGPAEHEFDEPSVLFGDPATCSVCAKTTNLYLPSGSPACEDCIKNVLDLGNLLPNI